MTASRSSGEGLRWRWLQAIAASDLPSTTRLVMHTLSLHMASGGGSCYPGLTLIAAESGLDKSTVRRHLRQAEKLGWIRRIRERRPQGAWGRTTYVPTIPPGDVGAEDPDVPGDVGAQSPYPEGVGAERPQVGVERPQVGAERPQGRGTAPTPRRGTVPTETVETDKETEQGDGAVAEAVAEDRDAPAPPPADGEDVEAFLAVTLPELVGEMKARARNGWDRRWTTLGRMLPGFDAAEAAWIERCFLHGCRGLWADARSLQERIEAVEAAIRDMVRSSERRGWSRRTFLTFLTSAVGHREEGRPEGWAHTPQAFAAFLFLDHRDIPPSGPEFRSWDWTLDRLQVSP
jgi:hypothetical protein